MKKGFLIGLVMLTLGEQMLAQDTTRLSMMFLGDIMQHDSQIIDAYDSVTKQYDYKPCFQYVKSLARSFDLAFGNLEVTLGGRPYKGYPQFSAPDELLVALKDMGMDVLVTANNHCVDRGRNGLERTIHMLDSFNILHTGTFADEVSKLNDHPLMIEKLGFRLALLNYTYGTNGLPVTRPNIVNHIDTADIRADLARARRIKPDAVIVFLHWGAEYQQLPSRSQEEFAEFCFNHGAQLVIGAHPHVLQPIEWQKDSNRLVVYSLGNFVSGQRTRNRDGGAMLVVELKKVAHTLDSAVTTIDSASYILEWVYRDPQKNYYVLPVPAFEHQKTEFIPLNVHREAFDTFVTDSRNLYKKHNKNIGESFFNAPDTIITYKVLFTTLKDPLEPWTLFPPVPYGVETETDDLGNVRCYSGNFLNRAAAEKYALRLREGFGYKDSIIVGFVSGQRIP